MKKIFFALPGNEQLTKSLAGKCDAEVGIAEIRLFPDQETYIKIKSDVKDKHVMMVCTLNYPDSKLLPLYFLSKTVKDLGAGSSCLVAPYLSYMRQDKQFKPGEAVTSAYFARLISTFADSLFTIDPHLHRRSSLAEIYPIPATVLHASSLIAGWIKKHVSRPLLVGPDIESMQWVAEVAADADAPYIILEKVRTGDEDVKVSVPEVQKYADHIPVLVDDIISTARTMVATVAHLINAGMKKPVCIGVHGIFSNDAYSLLLNSGAAKVVTCNTIPHKSNEISIDTMLYLALTEQ